MIDATPAGTSGGNARRICSMVTSWYRGMSGAPPLSPARRDGRRREQGGAAGGVEVVVTGGEGPIRARGAGEAVGDALANEREHVTQPDADSAGEDDVLRAVQRVRDAKRLDECRDGRFVARKLRERRGDVGAVFRRERGGADVPFE